jgi:hypothetical protein
MDLRQKLALLGDRRPERTAAPASRASVELIAASTPAASGREQVLAELRE